MPYSKMLLRGAMLAGVLCASLGALARGGEVFYDNDEFKLLDRFEAHNLSKSDKAFNKKDFKRSAAEYDAFILEFEKSKAIPYALLRKGRSLHRANKRYKAMRVYEELLDYFPDTVKYAAPAIYYIGLAHWGNGDVAKAMKEWAEMADDEDYSKHFLAADAINKLADNLLKQDKTEKATKYFMQIAVDFRTSNRGAASYAIGKVVYHYIRRAPSEPKLREFYKKVKSFGGPRKVPDKLDDDFPYWSRVQGYVGSYGGFNKVQTKQRKRYYKYWAGLMTGKFLKLDNFQITWANHMRKHDVDTEKWTARLDKQYKDYQKPGDWARTIRWIRLYRGRKKKVMEYYGDFRFDKMKNSDIKNLMYALYEDSNHRKMARNVFGRLRIHQMSDGEKASLARYFWHKDAGIVKDLCMRMKDKDFGKNELLGYYHWRNDLENGLLLADHLAGVPRYAKDALWKKAELLQNHGKLKKAILAFQQVDNPPSNLWRICDCYASLGNLKAAIQQLREVEAFFKDHAPTAALRIAHLYRSAGMKPEQIAALRAVLTKYPRSSQSSSAHQELERLGVRRIKGGVDADE